MTIIAALAGLVTLTLRTHLDNASLSRAFEQLREADRRARIVASASSGQPVALTIRKDEVVLSNVKQTFRLPRGVNVFHRKQQRDVRSGSKIQFISDGTSESYVLRVEKGSLVAWISVFGLSGQCLLVTDESKVQEFYNAWP